MRFVPACHVLVAVMPRWVRRKDMSSRKNDIFSCKPESKKPERVKTPFRFFILFLL
ncbi:MAG: hypothetical protein LBC02_02375 [Planctomycetaceae bacterium]|nr:hypothetical protein [Planctomycetaceae bacterium]